MYHMHHWITSHYVDVHQKVLARQIVAVAMLHASPVTCLVAVMQTTTATQQYSVAGVAHSEQELAADGYALQDGVDYDDDDVVQRM